jgi:hypothetical protein
MNVDMALLKNLISKRPYEIERLFGTGWQNGCGVGTFLDNEGDVDLLSSKQKVVLKFVCVIGRAASVAVVF